MSVPPLPSALAAALLPFALLAPFATSDASLAEAVSAKLASSSVDLEYWAGLETGGDGIALSRISVEPALEFRFDRAWSAELALRGDFADDDTLVPGARLDAAIDRLAELVQRHREVIEVEPSIRLPQR